MKVRQFITLDMQGARGILSRMGKANTTNKILMIGAIFMLIGIIIIILYFIFRPLIDKLIPKGSNSK
jgi:flagellar biosynthesis/type III secretory pathway M-ring protein FliF/YscJ